jgi:hypothetical protein
MVFMLMARSRFFDFGGIPSALITRNTQPTYAHSRRLQTAPT